MSRFNNSGHCVGLLLQLDADWRDMTKNGSDEYFWCTLPFYGRQSGHLITLSHLKSTPDVLVLERLKDVSPRCASLMYTTMIKDKTGQRAIFARSWQWRWAERMGLFNKDMSLQYFLYVSSKQKYTVAPAAFYILQRVSLCWYGRREGCEKEKSWEGEESRLRKLQKR